MNLTLTLALTLVQESRYPVMLSSSEKEFSRKVVSAFGQTMCGFDILRSNGGSYVCDVNGWSSVKDSPKFWDDAANLLRQYCLQAVAPSHYSECITRLPSVASARALSVRALSVNPDPHPDCRCRRGYSQ